MGTMFMQLDLSPHLLLERPEATSDRSNCLDAVALGLLHGRRAHIGQYTAPSSLQRWA
jgi:hypothetical protein